MKSMLKFLLTPMSWFYGMAVAMRNWRYDAGMKKSVEVDIPVVSVGNITVGGTGKTPMCELLVSHFRERYHVGVISLGYGRRGRGYREVETTTSWRRAGDEPRQIKGKFPDVVVAVCKDRVEGIARMRRDHPELNLIIMDDGFQYRRLCPKLNVVMVDYTRPIYKDRMLPLGGLRDSRKQMRRAHYVVVTKCPADMTPLDRRIISNNLELLPFQNLSFTRIVSGAPYPAFRAEGQAARVPAGARVVAMAALGNPWPFVEGLRERYDVRDTLLWPDHHPYVVRDLRRMEEALEEAGPGAVIVTTEKDAVKLGGGSKIPAELRDRIYVMPIEMGFLEETREEFLAKLEYDVRTDRKSNIFYSR
jgi:tetraacyldisaccharide 4'-kinase